PQAIDSSTATCAVTEWASATSPTARSMAIGPQAYTTCAFVRWMAAGSTSVTRPLVPAEPSSVVTVTPPATRLAASSPNSRGAVQGERPAQQHRRVVAADGHRDEVPGGERRRHSGRHHGELVVLADLLHGEDLADLLHRRHAGPPSVPDLSYPGRAGGR